MELKDLKNEMPYKWRVQSYSKNKPSASCVAYIDARDVMDMLDAVCSPENWQDDYRVVDGKLFAGIGIYTNDQWIWKWDTGTESQTEKEKGKVSDSFKRAAVKWGVGRFLYNLKIQYVIADGIKGEKDGVINNKTYKKYPKCVDSKGKTIWDITKHINDKS